MPHESEIFLRMKDGVFVKSAQIDPPLTTDLTTFDQEVGQLRQGGIQVLDINSRSKLSLDSLALAARYRTLYGFDIIPHTTPRDATIFGLTKQILTAYAMSDIQDFLVVSGDPEKISHRLKGKEHPDAIDAIAEIDSELRRSNLGLDIHIGAAFNQNAHDQFREERRTELKLRAGADFFMSQPVFNVLQAERAAGFYKRSLEGRHIPMIMGIWPLTSFEVIEKIHTGKIEGVVMDTDIYEEASTLPNRDALRAWSEHKTAEVVRFIKNEKLAQGVYIVAPYRRPSELVSFTDKIVAL